MAEALCYDFKHSSMLILSSSESSGSGEQRNNDQDAQHIQNVLRGSEFIQDSLHISSSGYSSKKGLQESFEKQLSKAVVTNSDGYGGLFVFVYCGKACDLWDHGLCLSQSAPDEDNFVIIEPDITKSRYVLILNDFKPESHKDHVSGATIGSMIANIESKPKQILVILDCPFAEEISSDLSKQLKAMKGCELKLYTLVSQSKGQTPYVIDALECSIFTYFLTTIWSKTEFTGGMFPLTPVFTKIRKCCEALSSVISDGKIMKNFIIPKAKFMKIPNESNAKMEAIQGEQEECDSCCKIDSGGHIRPIMKNFTIPKAKFMKIPNEANAEMEAIQEEQEECDSHCETDSGGQFGKFLHKYYKKRFFSRTKLHDEVIDWAHKTAEGPLTTLKEEGMFEGKVLEAVVESMMFSAATIQNELVSESIADSNIFIEAYIYVAAAIDITDNSVDVSSIPLLKRAQHSYMKVLHINSVKDNEMCELIEKMDRDTPNIFM